MARVQVALVLALCLCAGCGSSNKAAAPTKSQATTTEVSKPDQDPADFLKEIINQKALEQNGRLWETLHPFHQAVATRTEFVACEGRTPTVGEIKKTEILDQYEEPVRIPGQAKDVPSQAVTIRLTLTVPAVDKPQVATATAHAVAVNGEWRWILTPEDYQAYKANRCPPEH